MSYSDAVRALSPYFYWPMDDVGSTAKDISGSARNGTYAGSGTVQATEGFLGTPGSKAATFNGSGYASRVSVNAIYASMGATRSSIVCWIKPSADAGGAIFGAGGVQGAMNIVCQAAYFGGVRYIFTDSLNSANNLTVGEADFPVTGRWSHYAFVATDTTYAYYLNGTPRLTGTWGVALGPDDGNYGLKVIGQRPETVGSGSNAGYAYIGSISEAAWFNVEISAAQIAKLYKAGTRDAVSY